MDQERAFTAFAGDKKIASGPLRDMLLRTKEHIGDHPSDRILIFDDASGQQVDFDFRGTPEEVIDRADPPKIHAAPGRPKLGVVSREISLLPRHWEWLEEQPHGSSAALRRLVDEARKSETGAERARRARDAASRFMWAMAGNLPGFEEASRALFADDRAKLVRQMKKWPPDVKKHVERLLEQS